MNNTTNATLISSESISNMIPVIIITGLLLSVPVYCCIYFCTGVIHRYIYNYGEYTENSIDDTEKQLKCRGCYESLFGSILSPKLTKIIVVTIAFEN